MELNYQHDITDAELALFYEGRNGYYIENTHFKTGDGRLFKYKGGKIEEVKAHKAWGISTKGNPEQTFALEDILDEDISLIAITGHAGTGKTFISLVGALVAGYSKIIFTREVEQVGRDLGYLKGTVDDKFYPFMRPFYDNIEVIEQYAKKDLRERVSMEPLQFMRGATLTDTLLIVDEAQNCDLATLKMAISRAGVGSKVVLCGSLNQIDKAGADKENNGLTTVIERFTGQSCFSHIHLLKDERSILARLADELL